ncbi:hypothetical protein [Rhizobium cremeum]|uniref:hypothetical protein n=1 Tax=Rhizobium cremeum TaxID=2813827 RepID=UPI0039DF7302
MTPEQFSSAALELQQRGIIVSGHGWKTALAKLLGMTRQSIDNMEREGTRQRQTDLAISALIAGLPPFGEF